MGTAQKFFSFGRKYLSFCLAGFCADFFKVFTALKLFFVALTFMV